MAKPSPEKLAAALRANLKRRKLPPDQKKGQKPVLEPPSARAPLDERRRDISPKPPKNSG
jgi:hypothetical protein